MVLVPKLLTKHTSLLKMLSALSCGLILFLGCSHRNALSSTYFWMTLRGFVFYSTLFAELQHHVGVVARNLGSNI